SGSAYRGLVERVLERFGADFRWMLKGDEPPEWPGVGWHLTGRQLRKIREERCAAEASFAAGAPLLQGASPGVGAVPPPRRAASLFATSCPDAEALGRAVGGADLGGGGVAEGGGGPAAGGGGSWGGRPGPPRAWSWCRSGARAATGCFSFCCVLP